MNLSRDVLRTISSYLNLTDAIHFSSTCKYVYGALSKDDRLKKLRKVMASDDKLLKCVSLNMNERLTVDMIQFVLRSTKGKGSFDEAIRLSILQDRHNVFHFLVMEFKDDPTHRQLNKETVIPPALESDNPCYFAMVHQCCSRYTDYFVMATMVPNYPMKALRFVRDRIMNQPFAQRDELGLSAIRAVRDNCSQDCIDFVENLFPRGVALLNEVDENDLPRKRLKTSLF